MSAVERFLTMFEPEDNKVAFRVMLDEMVKEIKRKAEIDSEPLMMRDYFAAKVVSYLASEHKKEMLKDDCFDGWSDIDNDPTFDAEMVAMDAYAIADAMIKRRENK